MPSAALVPARSRPRAAVYAAVSLLGALAIALVAGEVWTRATRPRPPVQIVRGFDLHTIGGVPVWEWSTDRLPRACAEAHPERLRIMFLGSSITHGFSIPASTAFTVALEERLNTARPSPGFCVMNFAQPGFTSQQKLAVGTVEIPRYHPALVLWEGWNEFGNFVMVGDAAYEVRRYALRGDGFPGLRGVPDPINHRLFLASRLYEYMTLRFGEQGPIDEITPAKDRLERLAALTTSAGVKLGVYVCPRLDRPFRESVGNNVNKLIEEFAQAHQVPIYSLAQELVDQDYKVLRADDCCHYNVEGHRALVPVFERIVLAILDQTASAPAP